MFQHFNDFTTIFMYSSLQLEFIFKSSSGNKCFQTPPLTTITVSARIFFRSHPAQRYVSPLTCNCLMSGMNLLINCYSPAAASTKYDSENDFCTCTCTVYCFRNSETICIICEAYFSLKRGLQIQVEMLSD